MTEIDNKWPVDFDSWTGMRAWVMLTNLQAQITRYFYPHAVLTDFRLPWPNKGDKRHKTMAKLGKKFTCCTTSAAQRSSEKWHSLIRNALHNTYTKFGNETSTSRGDGNSKLMERMEQDNGSLHHLSIIAIKKALPTGNSFSFTNVMVNETYNLLMKMDCEKSTGFDDIPCKLMKIGSAPLAPPICSLVNLMFMESSFPDILKYAEVAALFKRLDNLNKGNYWPVSVLTTLSKVFEKVSCVQMSSYFESIFSKFLSGLGLHITVKPF